jgi:hypothetical protein
LRQADSWHIKQAALALVVYVLVVVVPVLVTCTQSEVPTKVGVRTEVVLVEVVLVEVALVRVRGGTVSRW